MISKQVLIEISNRQKDYIKGIPSFERDALSELQCGIRGYALVISGIRRCGKSTLLAQLLRREEKRGKSVFYLNFDTPEMYGFSFSDFQLIDELVAEGGYNAVFFDEAQVIEGWEIYVRGKIDMGMQVAVTGSNASMLSRELGTKLTGRHVTQELFPFSYSEYCGFKGLAKGAESLEKYLDDGGFPKYVETGEKMLLDELVNDILYRDIAVRYNIRDERTLKMALSLLLSNIGNLVSASKLKQQLGVRSTTTVSDYLSFFQQSYLLEFIPKFSYSYKVQMVNPRKVYCVDNGIVTNVSRSFSRNSGHKLENAVYGALRRQSKELYYYNEGAGECDFIVAKNGVPERAVQVCFELTTENRQRDVMGLLSAMDSLNLEKGQIVTFDKMDKMVVGGKQIEIIPFYQLF